MDRSSVNRVSSEFSDDLEIPLAILSAKVFAEEGHCPHAYAAEELAKKKAWSGHKMANAKEGAAALRELEEPGSSADEAPIRKQRCRRGY